MAFRGYHSLNHAFGTTELMTDLCFVLRVVDAVSPRPLAWTSELVIAGSADSVMDNKAGIETNVS